MTDLDPIRSPAASPLTRDDRYGTEPMRAWMEDVAARINSLAVAFLEAGRSIVGSVNGKTGIVVLDADDLEETGERKWMTDAERNKLGEIEAGAQRNRVTSVNGQTGDVVVPSGVQSVNGLIGVVTLNASRIAATASRLWLTPAERTKLAGIEAGATANPPLVILCGDSAGPTTDHGYRIDGGRSGTEYNPMIGTVGIGDSTGV